MQYHLLELLVCPVSKTKLSLTVISEKEIHYLDKTVTEIYEGLLHSDVGFIFPIIEGVPRLLIEGIYDYHDFLKKHVANFSEFKQNLFTSHASLIELCHKKNQKSKASFAFEWSFLNKEKNDRLWKNSLDSLSNVLTTETNYNVEDFKNKKCVDIGSGHGFLTQEIAKHSAFCLGLEASKAVEKAAKENNYSNAYFVQADLQYLPITQHFFDITYCSGVIHHTNDVAASFTIIEKAVVPNGLLCIWLYHPQKNLIHLLFLKLRTVTKHLPIKVTFYFLLIFIFPFTFLYKKITNKRSNNYREEMIDLLDMFSPEFREEVTHATAINWYKKAGYKDIKITTTDQFGFAIAAIKN